MATYADVMNPNSVEYHTIRANAAEAVTITEIYLSLNSLPPNPQTVSPSDPHLPATWGGLKASAYAGSRARKGGVASGSGAYHSPTARGGLRAERLRPAVYFLSSPVNQSIPVAIDRHVAFR